MEVTRRGGAASLREIARNVANISFLRKIYLLTVR